MMPLSLSVGLNPWSPSEVTFALAGWFWKQQEEEVKRHSPYLFYPCPPLISEPVMPTDLVPVPHHVMDQPEKEPDTSIAQKPLEDYEPGATREEVLARLRKATQSRKSSTPPSRSK